jgi:ATP-dependent RNA helicase RhlE
VSFETFSLDSRLMTGIRRAQYGAPTPIQKAAIPVALTGRDLIGTAQTGTGKTAAFVLPILQRMLAGERGRTRALIITPTRELAAQISDVIHTLGADTKVRSATIYGGVSMGTQINALRQGVEIIVACPGRLLDLLQQGYGRLDSVETLVLDEADRMFDMGFLPSIHQIMRKLPQKRQTLLFSATFPDEIEKLALKEMQNPQKVSVGIIQPAHTVAHALYPIPASTKTPFLLELLRKTDTESVLVFTRTKHRAERLAGQIAHAGFRVSSLHGNRTQGQRQNALDGFRGGKYQVLVATDIAARGIDVDSISHVINFDMPDTADAYLHRIGRTGRAERKGDAFTLVTPEDADMVRLLEKTMGTRLERRKLDGFDYENPPESASLPKPTRTGRRFPPAQRPGTERKPGVHAAFHRGAPSGLDQSNRRATRSGSNAAAPAHSSFGARPNSRSAQNQPQKSRSASDKPPRR